MWKLVVTLSLLFVGFSQLTAHEYTDTGRPLLRIGVWNNPPLVLQDADGQWSGISIDVLKSIAAEHGWKLTLVPGSFSEHLENLNDHKIDLLTSIAYSSTRAEKYAFTQQPLISNWGLVYAQPGSKIGSLIDLDGKRVAVMEKNIHDTAFRSLIEKFGVRVTIIEKASFRDVMMSVQNGEADAGVVNRLFGATNASKYELVETGIIFNPINIHYAAPRNGHNDILQVIDEELVAYKANPESIYYQAIQRYMHILPKSQFPSWFVWLVIGLLGSLLLMLFINMILRKKVAVRTRELQIEVDERRQAQEWLDRLAFYDTVTGLPNRVSFYENMKVAIAGAKRKGLKVALLFVDLDRFKTINDSLGHDVGDELIVHVADRLRGCLRQEDMINRFGGDEFVAILPNIDDIINIHEIAGRMLESLSSPIDVGVAEIYTSASIGVALYPDDDLSSEGLLKNADIAMYHAKAQGGNNYQFYNEDLSKHVHKRLSLETRLRQALENDELILHYQPIIELSTQKPVGVEALLRWEDPERGMIAPDEFISVAEETGIIIPFGEWVLEQACAQLKQWQDQGLGKLCLAVNVSVRQFEHHRIHESVINALNKSGLDAVQLELEITEGIFINVKKNVRDVLEKLRGEGVSLSIDDFGTGYSSLSYLKQLPINTLKIDRSFVKDIPDDKDDMQIANTIMMMAHGLDLDVVAEGIETEEQLQFFTRRGCTRAQGYFIARPQPPEEVELWLREHLAD